LAGLLDRAHVSTDDAPRLAFARPYSRVAVGASNDSPGHFNGQSSEKRRDGDILSHASDAELYRLVRSKSHNTGTMCLEILGFGRELAIGTGEQKVVRNNARKRCHVAAELGRAKLRFARDDFGVWWTNENGLEFTHCHFPNAIAQLA
jgi:hypothetical protein